MAISHPTDMCNLVLHRCLFTFFFANFELNYRFCERGANLENLKSKLFKVLSCQVQGHAKKMNVNCENGGGVNKIITMGGLTTALKNWR